MNSSRNFSLYKLFVYMIIGVSTVFGGMTLSVHLTQVIDKNIPSADPYYLRGRTSSDLGEQKGKREDYDKATQLYISEKQIEDIQPTPMLSSERDALHKLGTTYFSAMEDYYNKATRLYISETEPTNNSSFYDDEQDALHKLGTTYFNRGIAKGRRNRKEAISDLQKAAKLFSDIEARSDYQRVQVALRKLQP
ncbi:hypothetical protein Cri9333_0717 [Crinalium epipsammum PCC 9333]|uniref:Tetratricopeptide TPR_1 repeat-containing protein n=1 Tax=Crinalium epipsammum PCC 9333 TaxID=1173022 RepID=K9VVY8_9CYAN|nr:hypothetical protein [Crinalium epipsammum]AFZ11647.1 hypothetical protein Cri9333_0717 [Crinalium epipsammum PCC 9333]